MADLAGRVVAFLEARRSTEMANLIVRHGGQPLAAPCLTELHQPDAPELVAAVAELGQDAVTVAIFLTGVGTATVLESARHLGRESLLLAALARKRIVARGPKPVAVLRKAGVHIDLQAPAPHTTATLITSLADWDLTGHRVAVQLHGGPADEFLAALAARGATVVPLSPYVWGRAADDRPIRDLIDGLVAGQVDALLGTSAAQVELLMAVAEEQGQTMALRRVLGRIPVAAQGPICAAAFERFGIPVAIVPPTGHMGALVLAVAGHFERVNDPPTPTTAAVDLAGQPGA